MRTRLARRCFATAAVLLALMGLAGCGGGAFESNDYFMTWLTTRPADETIESVSGRTGDEDVDAVLSAAEVIDEIGRADIHQRKAREWISNGNLVEAARSLDWAIDMRPEDAGYRRDRAMVAIQQGDTKAALEQWDAQDEIARQNQWDLDPTYWMDAELDAGTEQERLEAEKPGPARDAALAATYTRLADIYERWAEARERGGGAGEMSGVDEMGRIAADYREKAAELTR